MPTYQYVNLTKDIKWAARDGDSVARMGSVNVSVRFNRKARRDFRYRVVPGDANVTYSDGEAARNGALRAPVPVGLGQTDANGVARFSVQLSAAGGDEFKIEAYKTTWKKEKEVQSTGVLTTARRLFYTFAAMPHTPVIDHGALRDGHWNEGEKRYIDLVKDGADIALADAPIFFSELESVIALRAELTRAGWSADARTPVGFTICLVHAIQREKVTFIQETFQVQVPDRTDAAFAGCTLNIPAGTLWQRPAGPVKEWFVNGSCEYTTAAGRTRKIYLGREMLTVGADRRSVDVAFSAAQLDEARLDAGTATLDVRVAIRLRLAKNMSGETYPDYKLIVLATERDGTAFTDDHVKIAIIHEIGHMMGMVHDGRGRHLDKPNPDTYYSGQGQDDAPHCNTGATYTAPRRDGDPHVWTGTQGCVMYGAARRDTTAGPYSPLTYCAGCSAVVRKIDLSRLGY